MDFKDWKLIVGTGNNSAKVHTYLANERQMYDAIYPDGLFNPCKQIGLVMMHPTKGIICVGVNDVGAAYACVSSIYQQTSSLSELFWNKIVFRGTYNTLKKHLNKQALKIRFEADTEVGAFMNEWRLQIYEDDRTYNSAEDWFLYESD